VAAKKKAPKRSKPTRPVAKSKARVAKARVVKAKARRVQAIPAGYHTVTPYVVVSGVGKLLEFIKAAFGAKVKHQFAMPDGTVMHAEAKIGDSIIMLGEPRDGKAIPCMLYLYVKDTDKVYKQALAAGATSVMEPANQFYGDRNAGVRDGFGNQWWIGTHIEDVSPKEMARRMAAQQPPK